MAEHGDQRNYRMERELARDEFEASEGKTVTVEYAGSECSVRERYCAHCREWIECRGVIGALHWLAHHRDGDCKEGPDV